MRTSKTPAGGDPVSAFLTGPDHTPAFEAALSALLHGGYQVLFHPADVEGDYAVTVARDVDLTSYSDGTVYGPSPEAALLAVLREVSR
jgi:hypothetical protein